MKIEKAECNYQVTECDLKFGEQITLDGELLIPVSVLDKLRAEIDAIEAHGQIDEHTLFARSGEEVKKIALEIIDKYIANNKDLQWKMENCCCVEDDGK